jgi:hypothetical protein
MMLMPMPQRTTSAAWLLQQISSSATPASYDDAASHHVSATSQGAHAAQIEQELGQEKLFNKAIVLIFVTAAVCATI